MKNSTEDICFKAFINNITFFSRHFGEHFENIKKINKLGNLNKITNTFPSLSKYGLKSTTTTLISAKLALTVVPKQQLLVRFYIITKSAGRVSISFSEIKSFNFHSSGVTGKVSEVLRTM